jgi:hypothetical protein
MVRRTICEMLLDRGYLLPSDFCAGENITLDQVRSNLASLEDISMKLQPRSFDRNAVLFSLQMLRATASGHSRAKRSNYR